MACHTLERLGASGSPVWKTIIALGPHTLKLALYAPLLICSPSSLSQTTGVFCPVVFYCDWQSFPFRGFCPGCVRILNWRSNLGPCKCKMWFMQSMCHWAPHSLPRVLQGPCGKGYENEHWNKECHWFISLFLRKEGRVPKQLLTDVKLSFLLRNDL